MYSAAFFAIKLPQLERVAFAAAPADVVISVATDAAAVADGASDNGRNPRTVDVLVDGVRVDIGELGLGG